MTTYHIVSTAGSDMGTYDGETETTYRVRTEGRVDTVRRGLIVGRSHFKNSSGGHRRRFDEGETNEDTTAAVDCTFADAESLSAPIHVGDVVWVIDDTLPQGDGKYIAWPGEVVAE